jgi:ABC-type multidrug transport system permease subunit
MYSKRTFTHRRAVCAFYLCTLQYFRLFIANAKYGQFALNLKSIIYVYVTMICNNDMYVFTILRFYNICDACAFVKT